MYNIDYFKKIAESKNGKCLSDKYVNCTTKLKFQCSKGHEWETKPYYLINNNSWCPKCNKSSKDNIETFHIIAKERNGKCLSSLYVNCRTKLSFECSKGHVWTAKPSDIKESKSWCPICSNSLKLTIDEMNEIANKRGGKCLSTEYVNSHSKLLWECENKHQWLAKPYLVKNLNTWCPICKESKGEKIIKIFLINKNILFEREKKFIDCIGLKQQLPFDFYLSNFNICIEYDGKQHSMPVNFYGCSNESAEKSFMELKLTDNIKTEYCINNNIKLIRIPYTIKNIEDFLSEKLKSLYCLE